MRRAGARAVSCALRVGVDEPGVVEVHQHLGRQDGHVGLALDEHLLEVPVRVDLAEHGLVVHRPLGIGRVEALVEGVEGFDERVAEAILGVLRTRVPEACMGIEDKRPILHWSILSPARQVYRGLTVPSPPSATALRPW